MSRFEAQPHPLLRPYVHSYWGFVRDLTQMGTFTVTPDCFLELLFFVDPPMVEDARGTHQLPACTLIPLLREPLRLITTGYVRCAAVRLHAWSSGLIFAQADDGTAAWYDASERVADLIPAVTDAVRRAAWTDVATLFDATLPRFLTGVQHAALSAVKPFLAEPGDLPAPPTTNVAAEHGRSRRQVERQVRALTDRSPKQLVCLRRFQFVRDRLWSRPDTALDALAIEAGYADQAHLTREFRRYAARSPRAFTRDCERLKTFLSDEDVAFVQDAVNAHAYDGGT